MYLQLELITLVDEIKNERTPFTELLKLFYYDISLVISQVKFHTNFSIVKPMRHRRYVCVEFHIFLKRQQQEIVTKFLRKALGVWSADFHFRGFWGVLMDV